MHSTCCCCCDDDTAIERSERASEYDEGFRKRNGTVGMTGKWDRVKRANSFGNRERTRAQPGEHLCRFHILQQQHRE